MGTGEASPQHRVKAVLHLSADNWADMQWALQCLQAEIAFKGRLDNSTVDAGDAYGWTVTVGGDQAIENRAQEGQDNGSPNAG
ncbi:hypothetical protein [Novosphingobium barchaimii]|nr:hypothetical protein [Novosphingobium barchaimii]